MLCFANEQFAPFDRLNGGLIIQLKLSDGIDILAKELNSNRNSMLPGEDIENTAAHCELAASGHLRDLFISTFISVSISVSLSRRSPRCKAIDCFWSVSAGGI